MPRECRHCDLGHLEFDDTGRDEGGNESGGDLSPERVLRFDVGVVGEFEIIGELNGVRARHIIRKP